MITPQLALEQHLTSLAPYLTNDDWVIEQKLDGNRLLICSAGDDVPPTAITRNGSLYSKRLPTSLLDFRFPKGTGSYQVVLDGELVGDTYWVFDLPMLDDGHGRNLADDNLQNRRNLLEALLLTLGGPFRLVPQAKTSQEKIALSEKALASNYEGLILKHLPAHYRSGARTPEWLKVKFVTTVDVIVTGVRTDGKDSVDLGLMQWDGTEADHWDLIDVGRASLIGKEKNGTIAVGDVLEVRYLYVGAQGRLYQPTIVRKRDDKVAHECTTEQPLKHVNKEVLATL